MLFLFLERNYALDKTQTLYINLDDSGALNKNELFCIYGGILFFSKKEKDKFITQYKIIADRIKCGYCKDTVLCNKKYPELKNYNLRQADKRQLLNYIKNYETIACIIKNEQIFPHIKNDNASRRRYTDYAIRRAIKEMINKLIITKKINPHKPLKIILNMDQQTTKNNGYYELNNAIKEELLYGIVNFNYSIIHKPILFSSLEIKLSYLSSSNSYVIQGSDLIAGTVRRNMIFYKNNPSLAYQKNSFITYKTILP